MAFMLKGLQALDEKLKNHSSGLIVRIGNPQTELPKLVDALGARAVFANHDYSPYSTVRDEAIQSALDVPLHLFHDAVIMPPGTVRTNDDGIYTVYTPFKKKWRKLSKGSDFTVETDLPGAFHDLEGIDRQNMPSLDDLGFGETIDVPQAGEDIAFKRLCAFTEETIYGYDDGRNELALEPFEGSAQTSQLSPYFRMGMLSPRQAIEAARDAYSGTTSDKRKEAVTTWVDELIWREFYMHVMHLYPHVYRGNFRTEYDDLPWEQNDEALQAWKDGQTGYPIVDAAMRQLNATGWMPNRARMFVASFLTKDLFIDWREGETYFMQKLLDGDPAANNGGWQWAAGTGTDAQPYFRIFNPVSQSTKFDPDGAYIRRWVPELASINDEKKLHEPWTLDSPPKNYPDPIINHKEARQRTLDAFKAVRNS